MNWSLRAFGLNRSHLWALALLSAFLVTALPTSTAQAGLFDDDEARKAILELRARFETHQRDMGERLNAMSGRIDRLEQTARGQIELSNQIEQLRNEMARLRGQMEVQANELAELQKRSRDQIAQLNERFRRFDPVPITVDGKSFQIDPAEKRSFDAAMTMFQAGDFKNAQAALTTFVAQNPQSPYRINAEYWSASAQFAQREWRAAATSLASFITKYQDSPRIPEALLSLAGAQIELKEIAPARTNLEQLIQRYPDSSAAREARERLAGLPLERPTERPPARR